MLVQKDSEPNPMDLVLILMNAMKIHKHVDMMQYVKTQLVVCNLLKKIYISFFTIKIYFLQDLHVHVHKVMMEILIMACVLCHTNAVHQTTNVVRMKNVYNQVNVFVHHHSLLMLEMHVQIHVRDSLVVSTPDAVQQIVSFLIDITENLFNNMTIFTAPQCMCEAGFKGGKILDKI